MIARLRAAGLVWPTLSVIAGLAVLLGLGNWQMQRRAWKEGLIADIALRTRAAPVPIGKALEMWRSGESIEYLRVTVRGRFHHDRELHAYALERGAPGWHVITPLETERDGVALIVRGFVPDSLKQAAQRPQGQVAGEADITGLARAAPTDWGWFAPPNQPDRNQWYRRDLGAMLAAAFQNTERPYVPFFIEAEARPVGAGSPGDWPRAGVTRLELPNRHLEYALTWYGLAVTLIAVYVAFVLGQPRARARAAGRRGVRNGD